MSIKEAKKQKIKSDFKLYNCLESTNSFVLSNSNKLNDKDVVIASTQTSGRGRFSRKWVSNNSSNLYLSIVLKPDNILISNYPLSTITHFTAISLLKTLKSFSPSFSIKWPNDIFFNEKEKISGILCESSIKGDTIEVIAVGVGVNLNMSVDELESIDQPATSLNLITGLTIDKIEFAKLFTDIFFEDYHSFIEKGFDSIIDFYSNNCHSINKYITVKNGDSEISGNALRINNSGEILISNNNNETKTLTIGDIICCRKV